MKKRQRRRSSSGTNGTGSSSIIPRISISLESSELLELFQWSGTDLEAARKKPEMTEELADVMIYCIYMANALNIDIPEAIQNKIDKNAAKYPVEKAKGKSKKYTEL